MKGKFDKEELPELIRDYKAYKSMVEGIIRNNPNHCDLIHLKNVIKMCDEKLVYLYTVQKEGDKS